MVDIFKANVLSSGARGCSMSTVKNPVSLANLHRLQPVERLQPVATDSKKTMYTVSYRINVAMAS